MSNSSEKIITVFCSKCDFERVYSSKKNNDFIDLKQYLENNSISIDPSSLLNSSILSIQLGAVKCNKNNCNGHMDAKFTYNNSEPDQTHMEGISNSVQTIISTNDIEKVNCRYCGQFKDNRFKGVCSDCIKGIFKSGGASTADVGRLCNVSAETLARMDNEGKLVSYRRSMFGYRKYKLEDVEAYYMNKGEKIYVKTQAKKNDLKDITTEITETINQMENNEKPDHNRREIPGLSQESIGTIQISDDKSIELSIKKIKSTLYGDVRKYVLDIGPTTKGLMATVNIWDEINSAIKRESSMTHTEKTIEIIEKNKNFGYIVSTSCLSGKWYLQIQKYYPLYKQAGRGLAVPYDLIPELTKYIDKMILSINDHQSDGL